MTFREQIEGIIDELVLMEHDLKQFYAETFNEMYLDNSTKPKQIKKHSRKKQNPHVEEII